MNYELFNIANKFNIHCKVLEITAFGDGLINTSFKVVTDSSTNYLLQKINHHIFKNVEGLQQNIVTVSQHIKNYLEKYKIEDADRKHLTVISSEEKPYFFDGENYWRLYIFIPNAKSYNKITPELAAKTGVAIAEFQQIVSDIELSKIEETIPDFHNLSARLQQFEKSLEINFESRKEKASDLISKIFVYKEDMLLAEQLFEAGKLPKRIQHCDTKINNILFDENDNILCMVDLDTCMPNFVFSDYGDFVRTACNTSTEDEPDLSKVTINKDIYYAFDKTYRDKAQLFLSQLEMDLLP